MNDQTVQIVNVLVGLITVLVGIGGLTGLGLLAALVLIVRNIRHDKALESAIEKLYASTPTPIQSVIKNVGDLASEVGGLVGDVSYGASQGTTTTTTTIGG